MSKTFVSTLVLLMLGTIESVAFVQRAAQATTPKTAAVCTCPVCDGTCDSDCACSACALKRKRVKKAGVMLERFVRGWRYYVAGQEA